MASAPNAVKTLRRFYKDRLTWPDPNELLQEIQSTGSDRAIVILMAAFIDDALETALSNKMRRMEQPQYEQAFRPDGPLGSFSARIEVSYLLQCIDDTMRGRLDDLREMRNACAHSKRLISFKDSQLVNVCRRVMKDAKFPIYEETPMGIRRAFVSECFYLFNLLIGRTEADVEAQLNATESERET